MTTTPKTPPKTYQEKFAGLEAEKLAKRIDQDTYDELSKELVGGEYGPQADLTQFESLLSKLEGSKMKQQRQKSVEGRRDIYSQGLSSMMANF
jgi:hypothetical protein